MTLNRHLKISIWINWKGTNITYSRHRSNNIRQQDNLIWWIHNWYYDRKTYDNLVKILNAFLYTQKASFFASRKTYSLSREPRNPPLLSAVSTTYIPYFLLVCCFLLCWCSLFCDFTFPFMFLVVCLFMNGRQRKSRLLRMKTFSCQI